jgi:hypothetical protein
MTIADLCCSSSSGLEHACDAAGVQGPIRHCIRATERGSSALGLGRRPVSSSWALGAWWLDRHARIHPLWPVGIIVYLLSRTIRPSPRAFSCSGSRDLTFAFNSTLSVLAAGRSHLRGGAGPAGGGWYAHIIINLGDKRQTARVLQARSVLHARSRQADNARTDVQSSSGFEQKVTDPIPRDGSAFVFPVRRLPSTTTECLKHSQNLKKFDEMFFKYDIR